MTGTERWIAAPCWAIVAQSGKFNAPLREPPFPEGGTLPPAGGTLSLSRD